MPNSLLLRKSTEPDKIALSYNDANGKINHSLIVFDQNISKFHFKDGSREKGEKNLWNFINSRLLGFKSIDEKQQTLQKTVAPNLNDEKRRH